MDCPSCGTDNPSSAISCRACGRDLPGQASGDGVSTPAVDQDARTLIFPDEPDLPGFGSRYEVKRLLGQGGMGAVYHAWDRELDRDIALKEIRPELVDQPDVIARFKREIQLASEITHPNVLRVYDLGAAEGKRFLTMQYVDGMTLSAHLRRGGLPETREAVSIFRQLCAALAAAHDKGVVHRDMKPGNVMINADGQAFVMDFGLARSLALSGLTQTGAVLGTPHYMSPEQVSGQKVDARTDVYALGVMLFQMLTGELPFQGESTFEIMMQRVQKDPPAAHELNPEIPSYLGKILERCMERDPSLRYADASEILADLDAQQVETNFLHQVKKRRKPLLRMAVGVLLALIVAGGFWLGRRSETRSTDELAPGLTSENVAREAPSLAIVPFANRTGDADLDWYGEGVARLIMDNLAQSRHVRVVSMDRIRDLLEVHGGTLSAAVAAESGIDNLMTGEIMKGPEGLTVTTRLTDTGEGREVASKRLDGLSEELLIQGSDDLAQATRSGLGIPPTESVDVYAADFASRNREAYNLYIEALGHWADYRYEESEVLLDRALEMAPDFTMARYRLAMVKADTSRTDEAQADIEVAMREASRLPQREGLYIQAAEAYIGRRLDDAIAAYQSLLDLYPYETEARHLLAQILDLLGRYEEEQEHLDILSRLVPDDPTVWSMQGNLALHRQDFSKAIQDFQRYIELLPDSPNGVHLLGDAYRGQGELDLAAEQYIVALDLDPDFHYSATSLAVVEFLQAKPQEAESRLRALAANGTAPHRNRIDAGFELAAILRSQERFREAAAVLSSMAQPIAEEQIREAMSLAVQGMSWMEIKDLSKARDLIEEAIEKSPGVPTRYLFARGLLELAEDDLEQVLRTADQILESALPPDNPDRTEDKVAAYLKGLVHLSREQIETAIEELNRAISLDGYEYAIYRVALARALLMADRHMEAMAAARQAADQIDHSDPRLDLQLDRLRAKLVLAQVQEAMDRPEAAAELANELLETWSQSDPGLPDIEKARDLLPAPE